MELNLLNRESSSLYIQQHKKAPLFDALKNYINKDMVAYHTPGHKQGKGIDPEILDLLGANTFKIDLTELDDLDNLHEPVGVIKEAQELVASAYNTDFSFFLINGSTAGNHVMIMSVCNAGDKIIIPRNIHKSVLGGIILAGAIPIYISSIWDKKLGFSHGFNMFDLENTLKEHPDAKAVLLVNPTYYGISTDIKSVIELTHKYNIPVLVDEAHGAHFHFHEKLPMSALDAGADMVVQSTHKILSSMTQSSVLHIKKGRISLARAKNILSLLQSTSPSYILMVSLDVARRQMVLNGRELLDRTINLAEYARKRLNKITGISCFEKETANNSNIFDFDLTKLIIDFSDLGISGFTALDLLINNYNIQSEMANMYNVLEIVTIGNDKNDLDKLIEAVNNLSKSDSLKKDLVNKKIPNIPNIPKTIIKPQEAFYADTETIIFKHSVGRVCAEIISPYPPGIPIISVGEEITQEVIEYLKTISSFGDSITGMEDLNLNSIKVVKN